MGLDSSAPFPTFLHQGGMVTRAWYLNCVAPVYDEIKKGRKTYDTRAPDSSNPEKRYQDARAFHVAIISVVDENFRPVKTPNRLIYEINDVQIFQSGGDWEECVRRMLASIGIEKVFPGMTEEQALEMYRQWPSTPRIKKEGLVAIGFGDRLE